VTFNEIVHRFEASRSGDSYKARCPSHPDDRASLSITETSDRTLLYCHAGCTFDQIIRAKNLTPADLFVHANGNGAHGRVNGRH
jgi:hypothetical protein